jgi:hypothetical protein
MLSATLDDAFERGAVLFDSGAFFEAHEMWEERWRVETDPMSRLYLQGLIQIAAAFHKLLAAGSPDSASRLLAKGLAKLDACPTQAGDENRCGFRDGIRACAQALSRGGFDRSAIPKLAARGPSV